MIKIYNDMIQGSDEWHAARCGLLTASEMKLIVTPTLKVASNDKERQHLYELMYQRVTKYVEPHYVSDDMLRGRDDEIEAVTVYHDNYHQVDLAGFITNDKWGFTIGYSPDGLIGTDGLIEAKSRRGKYQMQTICENVSPETCPEDYMLQVQTGLLVSERKWCDLISYHGGLSMATMRVYPDEVVQKAIVDAAGSFEERMKIKLTKYNEILASKARLIPTERKIEEEIYL